MHPHASTLRTSAHRPTTLVLGLVSALVAALVAPATASAASEPAGGGAIDQVIIATVGAIVASGALGWLVMRHRETGRGLLARGAALSERVSRLPGWAALPSGIAAGSLLVALLGMYWDISLHVDNGRDAGPLANPAHYLILIGLFGVFSAGCIAVALPRGERPGPAAVRIREGWYAPIGGLLMGAAGAFALLGFPLDDMWHRMFGQDVTLWGPTHMMLIGGAGMTLIGQAILLGEGMRARGDTADRREDSGRLPAFVTALRRVALMGGLLIGCATFQGEFDFGVPQFSFIFQPLLIALGAGVALVAARIWIGPGGAIGAALFFLTIRGAVSLIVGPVFGQTTPALPLYLGEALCLEAATLALGRNRPIALGLVGGLLAGAAGFWSEWAWSQVVMPIPWTADLLPEGLVSAALAGTAGGVVGGLLGSGLRGRLPRPAVARAGFAGALVVVAALVANGLILEQPRGLRATVAVDEVRPAPQREGRVTVRVQPPDAAANAGWFNVTAWQGGGRVVDNLKPVANGVYRSTQPVPLHGDWKTVVRLHRDRILVLTPIFLPRDEAIPAPEVPASAVFSRPFTAELPVLQRERKQDVPDWLFAAASFVVLAISLAFLAALAWGVGRIGRTAEPEARQPGPQPRIASPKPIGAEPQRCRRAARSDAL
jgi:hypothetical protein